MPKLSFRIKLLISLAGLVTVLLFFVLSFIHIEISRQTDWITEKAAERSQKAFDEIEELYRSNLDRFRQRFSGNPRIAGALEAALEDGDPGYLAEVCRYELTLSRLSDNLILFTDDDGGPFLAMRNGEAIEWPGDLGVNGDSGITSSGGVRYDVFGGELFALSKTPLVLIGRTIGMLIFGFPVDSKVAERLAVVNDSEVCFVSGGRCVVSTAFSRKAELDEHMIDAAGGKGPRIRKIGGNLWALIAEPLNSENPEGKWRVLAVPLFEDIEPLQRIRRGAIYSGMGTLAAALIISMVLSHRLTEPIGKLVKATEWVKRGELNKRVSVKSDDEFRTLADSFNDMTGGLLLKEKYRGVLDKVVSPEIADELLDGEIKLGGEIREVTTLFADIRDFTELTEGMEPGDVITMLNEYMERAGNAVEKAGGVVDKYVGDQVMAIFGAPVDQDDSAMAAVMAAVYMNKAIAELNAGRRRTNKETMHLGIGINTGPAVAGNMGSPRRLNYTVIGESVNVASRICGRAEPDEILVSGYTYEIVKESVKARFKGSVGLKGISRPVDVYTVERTGFDFKE